LRGAGRPWLAILLLTLIAASLAPVGVHEAGAAGLERRLYGGSVVDSLALTIQETIIDLDTRDGFVASYPYGDYLVVVRALGVSIFDPSSGMVVAEWESDHRIEAAGMDGSLLVLAMSVYTGEGVDYNTSLLLLRLPGLVKEAELSLPGDPIAVDVRDGRIGVVSANSKGLFISMIEGGEVRWMEATTPDHTIPDEARVYVQPNGRMLAVSLYGLTNNTLVLYDDLGVKVLWKPDMPGNPNAAWSPDGRLFYYEEGDMSGRYLVALDVYRGSEAWRTEIGSFLNKEILANPNGCCVYVGMEDMVGYKVFNASNGAHIAWFDAEAVRFHSSGNLTAILFEDYRLKAGIMDPLGYALWDLGYTPVYTWDGLPRWDVEVEDYGLLEDGRYYTIAMYRGNLRIAVVDNPPLSVVYLDAGAYADYYEKVVVARQLDNGDLETAFGKRGVLVSAGPGLDVFYALTPGMHAYNPKYKTHVTIIGPPGYQEYVRDWMWSHRPTITLPDIQPFTVYRVDIEDVASQFWAHLILHSWPECPLKRVEVAVNGTELPDLSVEKGEAVYALLANQSYTLTLHFEPTLRTLFGDPPPRTIELAPGPREEIEMLANDWARLVVEGDGYVDVKRLDTGELEERVPSGENGSPASYCLPPGRYTVILHPYLGLYGKLVAPEGWQPTVNLTLAPREEYRIDITGLYAGMVGGVRIVNTGSQPLVVALYPGEEAPDEPSLGYVVEPGSDIYFDVVANHPYVLVYVTYNEPATYTEPRGQVRFQVDTPGQLVTIKIPEGTITKETPTPAPTPSQEEANTPQQALTTTTAEAGGGGISHLMIGAAILIIAAAAGLLLLARR